MLTPSQQRKRDELIRRLLRTDQRIDVYMDEERIYEHRTFGAEFVGRYIGKKGPAAVKFCPIQFHRDLDAVRASLRASGTT